jgi:hypothetical protein
MAEVFVEPDNKEGGYRALQNHKVICRGGTQLECAKKAHDMRPSDTIQAARVLHEPGGTPDKWRTIFHPKR